MLLRHLIVLMIDVRAQPNDDHPAKVETTFATRIVAETENAEHMIRKTIYACRMYPI